MTKRLFVALEISEEVRRKASVYIETLRQRFPSLRIGWEKPENLHLTIKFIGDTSDERFDDLMQAVSKSAGCIAPFRLVITGTGVFPSPRKASVLWVDVKGETEKLQELNKIVEGECERQGFPKEKREFKPHLTLARLREPHKSKELVEQHLGENFAPVEVEINEIIIYRSILRASGSVYSKVASYELKETQPSAVPV